MTCALNRGAKRMCFFPKLPQKCLTFPQICVIIVPGGAFMSNFIDKLVEAGIDIEMGGKDERLMHCPFCEHHNPKLSYNVVKDVWRCLVCDEKGNASKLARKLGLPEERSSGASYMESRGFDLNVSFIPENVIVKDKTIDFVLLDGKSIQSRKIDAKHKGDRFKITGTSCGYGANVAGNTHLLIVEGNFDALAASNLLPRDEWDVVATLGITNRKFLDLLPLQAYSEIVVAFDNEADEADQARIKSNRNALVGEIKERSTSAHVFTIDNISGEFKDLADEWKANGDIVPLMSRIEKLKVPVGAAEDTEYDTIDDLFDSMADYLSNPDKVRGQTTFSPGLDYMLGGGKRTGEITVTCAPAKTGKNTFWYMLMHKALTNNIPVGFASREVSPNTEVLPSLFSLEYKKAFRLIAERGELDKMLPKAKEKAKEWPLFFAKGYGVFDINALTKWVKSLKKNKGVTHFWVDHLHHCTYESEDFKEVAKLMTQLKTLAKTEDVHIDLIIQPKALQQKGVPLDSNSLRGGAALGQLLDNLIIVERHPNDRSILVVRLELARSPLARDDKKVYFQYNKETTELIEGELVDEDTENAISTPGYRE